MAVRFLLRILKFPNGPPGEKTCLHAKFMGLQPDKSQTSMLSYTDLLEYENIAYNQFIYNTKEQIIKAVQMHRLV